MTHTYVDVPNKENTVQKYNRIYGNSKNAELINKYWREREDEVDFIIEYDKRCIAIEVKSGRRTGNEGLSVFRDKFHPIQSFVVGSGGIPLGEFLSWNIGRLLDNL